MKPSLRKRMIAGAIATLLAAPAWTASVTTDDPAKARTGAQTGSESRSDTGSSSRTGTSQSGTAYGSGTASGSAGASTAASGTDSTSRSMGVGTAKADNPLYSRTVDDLVGTDIVDATGDDIGEIEKIVLSQDRRGAHAVVSVGGFLGVAEHDIVVSLDELEPAGDDKWRLNATKEQLEARPQYQSEQYVELEGDQPISGSITDFAALETDRNKTTGTSRDSDAPRTMDKMVGKDKELRQPSTRSDAAGASAGTTDSSATRAGTGSTSHSMAGTAKADNPLYSRTADDLVGAEILDSTSDDIGKIKKIVLTQDRRSAHAVVSVGGFLGIGAHDIVVSLDELEPAEDDKWRLNATKEQLKARPEYQSEQYVELDGDQPISGSITDFAAFETDRNETTGTSRDSDATRTIDKKLDKDKEMRQPSTGSDAAGASGGTTGSGATK